MNRFVSRLLSVALVAVSFIALVAFAVAGCSRQAGSSGAKQNDEKHRALKIGVSFSSAFTAM